MNRRTFISAGVAAFAFSTRRVFGQIDANMLSGTRFVSELTGAEIDLGRTGLELVAQMLNDETGDELITFRSDTLGGAVRFVPSGTDPKTYIDTRLASIDEQSQVAELLGTGVMDDGGWMALSTLSSEDTNYAMYLEFQLHAFPGYDLEVFMSTDPELFHDDLELMQAVLVEGMEPFLFMEESQIDTMQFPALSASTTTQTNNRLNSSGSRRSNRTGTGTSTETMDEETVIEAVRAHQATFMEELDTFYGVVDSLAESDGSDETEMALFTTLMDLMFSWMGYPGSAVELTFPSSLASLESQYFEWADGVGEMGVTMSSWMLGEGEIDEFLDAIDVAVQLNSVLSAELRTLGVVIKPVGQGFVRPANFRRSALNTFLSRHKVA